MLKSFRLFALVAALSLTLNTPLRAEQTGTNPHPPSAKSLAAPSPWSALLALFGF